MWEMHLSQGCVQDKTQVLRSTEKQMLQQLSHPLNVVRQCLTAKAIQVPHNVNTLGKKLEVNWRQDLWENPRSHGQTKNKCHKLKIMPAQGKTQSVNVEDNG